MESTESDEMGEKVKAGRWWPVLLILALLAGAAWCASLDTRLGLTAAAAFVLCAVSVGAAWLAWLDRERRNR